MGVLVDWADRLMPLTRRVYAEVVIALPRALSTVQ